MMDQKRYLNATLTALVVAVVVVCTLVGCKRKEEVYTADKLGYEHDPAYRAQLKQQRDGQSSIFARRAAVDERMALLVKKCGGRREIAEKLPEWKTLVARQQQCDKDLEANRLATAAIIRDRINRAVEDGKKVRRGEAKAIDVSKEEVKK